MNNQKKNGEYMKYQNYSGGLKQTANVTAKRSSAAVNQCPQRRLPQWLACSLAFCFLVVAVKAADQILPYGMVVQLRNDANLPQSGPLLNAHPNLTASQNQVFGEPRLLGGDLGEKAGNGFTWTMLENDVHFDVRTLPPGILFAFRHSINQQDFTHPGLYVPDGSEYNQVDSRFISINGISPIKAKTAPPGLAPIFGGDFGAPANEGFYWFETTGSDFHGDWSIVDRLPQGTVIGLKHSIQPTTKNKKITWADGVSRDPVTQSAPNGFVQMFGGDLGVPSKQGYWWYEKTSGAPPALPAFNATVLHEVVGNQINWGVELVNVGNGAVQVPFVVELQITLPGAHGHYIAFLHTPGQLVGPGEKLILPPDSSANTGAFGGDYKVTILIDPEHRMTQDKDKEHIPSGHTVRFDELVGL
jgi:hypothetical protein